MHEPNIALIVDLVSWIAKRPRTYEEVMDAWRSSCPRLTIWEDAVDQGLVFCETREGESRAQTWVLVSRKGEMFLNDSMAAS